MRIRTLAPHLLIPRSSLSSPHSRCLAKRPVSQLLHRNITNPGKHQLLISATTKWNGWFSRSLTEKPAATSASHADTDAKQIKPAASEKPFRRLLALAHPERLVIGASVACLCVSSAVTMSVPYCIGKILDIIFTDSFLAEKLTTFCLGMVGVFVIGAAANFGRIYLMNGACE